jgi:Reverse transcriptase (RNA-dependent DNA polymerase)
VPILFVLKKSGELWLCIDYYILNAMIIKNCYLLLLINELLDWLDGSVIFSKINLWNIYYWIRICEEDEWKTVFWMWYGHFKYLIMFFELTNASAIFQAYINHVLRGLVDDFCVVYLNNILIFSKTKEEHLQYLELVIKHLHHTDLYINSKKCDFFKSQVKYLDFIINKNSI